MKGEWSWKCIYYIPGKEFLSSNNIGTIIKKYCLTMKIFFYVKTYSQIAHICYKNFRERLKIVIWLSLIWMPEKNWNSFNRNRELREKEIPLIIKKANDRQMCKKLIKITIEMNNKI